MIGKNPGVDTFLRRHHCRVLVMARLGSHGQSIWIFCCHMKHRSSACWKVVSDRGKLSAISQYFLGLLKAIPII
jgi:hypothetical protein